MRLVPGRPESFVKGRSVVTLFDALRVLADSHTRDDHQMGFIIEAALPSPYVMRHSMDDYNRAWAVVREQLHMQTEPQK